MLSSKLRESVLHRRLQVSLGIHYCHMGRKDFAVPHQFDLEFRFTHGFAQLFRLVPRLTIADPSLQRTIRHARRIAKCFELIVRSVLNGNAVSESRFEAERASWSSFDQRKK